MTVDLVTVTVVLSDESSQRPYFVIGSLIHERSNVKIWAAIRLSIRVGIPYSYFDQSVMILLLNRIYLPANK
ncbi:hypothetical protein [Dyadobacter psychrotolerans]|uniref:Uncharacterized protein n=1 Tax=Dyadobacter psychrotolerans TaxID=2541721 RepID=A0A4R5DIX4_9BACT|nr:hypothetical protein [Dyadobacter psychrotolerans]TDE10735.1 hypothetical protein E0F88_27050 [Dyadobacter psychrotolerans]